MATRLLTEDELRVQYGNAAIDRLSTRGGTDAAPADVIERAILTAESEALSTLRQRFSEGELDDLLPDADSASLLLKTAVAGVAYEALHDHYDTTPGKAIEHGKRGRATFVSIAAGEMSALLTGAPTVDSARGVVIASKRGTSLRDQPITLLAMDDWGHR